MREGVEYIKAQTLREIEAELAKAKKEALVFLDVDDTLITPKSKVFRSKSPYRFIIDEIKRNQKDLKNFEMILSHWRLQRKSILVAEAWPQFINELKTQFPVYALTKMDIGVLGAITSMEEWRYQELSQKGIIFSTAREYEQHFAHQEPTFYRGIFLTGAYKKSDVVRQVVQINQPSEIILVDDREEYLLDVDEECQRQGIPFRGILFKGVELLEGQPNADVAEFQKKYLLEKSQWLEDEEAEEMMLGSV